jgi:pimeloyl-ACP methyl ester carboxylesterase
MNLRKYLPVVVISLLIFIVNACGGGGGDTIDTVHLTSSFNLDCDLNATYTPIAAPISSAGTGTPTTTVIALHGKNGSPAAAHMMSLAADLNAQGFNVTMPYLPWSGTAWNGTLCEGMSYINSLIASEINAGNSVVLLGHSLAGPIVLSYTALSNTTKPDAVTVLAPGHFVHNSSVLANLHAPSIQSAKEKIAAGLGDVIATFQTSNGGVLVDLSTTPNVYLSFHDPAQYPDIKATIPLVAVPALWLAGSSDPLTTSAKSLGIINAIPESSSYEYKEIDGDHFTMVGNVPAELVPWYQGL